MPDCSFRCTYDILLTRRILCFFTLLGFGLRPFRELEQFD